MATKKPTSAAKKSTVKKSTTSKPKTTTKVTTVKAVEAPKMAVTAKRPAINLPDNLPNIVIAEVVGTFILTLVALLAIPTLPALGALFTGLALVVLVITIGAISGAHVNPAVTIGLWSARRVKSILVPFYLVAQFLGAAAAAVVLSYVSNATYGLDFSGIGSLNWGIFIVELIGAAVFVFGVTAATSRSDTSASNKALGVGLSLTAGLLVATSLFAALQGGIDTSKINALKDVPHELRVSGPILNPAIALAATDKTDSQLQNIGTVKGDKQVSRLSAELILGTLIGAVLGANLFVAASYRFKK